MDLKFIYIENFRNLQRFQVNFANSENHKFSYENNKMDLLEGDYVDGSFFGENISAVHAIIGENGSGKTNLADLIHLNLSNFRTGSSSYFKKDVVGIFVIGLQIVHHESIAISNKQSLNGKGFTLLSYEKAPYEALWKPPSYDEFNLNQASYIYYSNIFNDRYSFRLENLSDVSTNYLIYEDVYDPIFFSLRQDLPDSLIAYYRFENIRVADYVLSHSVEFIDLHQDYPFFFRLSTSYDNMLIKRDERKNLREIENSIFLNLRASVKYDKYDSVGIIESSRIKVHFKELFLLNILRTKEEIPEDLDPTKFVFDDSFVPISFDIGQAKELFLELLKYGQFEEGRFLKRSDYAAQFYKNEWEQHIPTILGINFRIPSKRVLDKIKKLISLIKGISHLNRFGFYGINENLSSGQRALLTLYSRLFYARRLLPESVKYIKVFIDEGDVNLHPEWQRQFFDKLLDYLKRDYSEYQVQLLITTHNPFLVSDIPKTNITFLSKDEKNHAVVKDYDRDKTFASNIHTLLTDSFFMHNGLVGEFAKSKLEQIIQFLTNNINDTESKQDITQSSVLQLIKIIGEPIVVERLMDMYESRFGTRPEVE